MVYAIVTAGMSGAFWVSTLEVRVSDMRPTLEAVARSVEINSNRITKLETQVEVLNRSLEKLEVTIAGRALGAGH